MPQVRTPVIIHESTLVLQQGRLIRHCMERNYKHCWSWMCIGPGSTSERIYSERDSMRTRAGVIHTRQSASTVDSEDRLVWTDTATPKSSQTLVAAFKGAPGNITMVYKVTNAKQYRGTVERTLSLGAWNFANKPFDETMQILKWQAAIDVFHGWVYIYQMSYHQYPRRSRK